MRLFKWSARHTVPFDFKKSRNIRGDLHFAAGVLIIAAILTLGDSSPSIARVFADTVTELDNLPQVRPDFPRPADPNILFYIEHSTSPNTVVYTAQMDIAGHLDRDEPIIVFWRRFNSDGARAPLSFLERMFAYGVNVHSTETSANAITANLVSFPQRTVRVDLDGQGKPRASTEMAGHQAKLVYAYVDVDETGLIPYVRHVDIFGIDLTSGRALHELVRPLPSRN